uniref:tRNA threonylcarbamoyladenosine biosynthesis protein TsaE n=1 Tax=uncultured bacterium contig00030 TaxID=1181519 RepID=A0A806K084_9BACT|nr:ATPase YjeE [uncultured bacterium contig00030]
MIHLVSNSAQETAAIGQRIASSLEKNAKGRVVALTGELGSGKTCLVKGIALALGVSENVTSPTYTIISEYACRSFPAFYHIDAYRLNCENDFEDIGGVEIIKSGCLCLVEWADRIMKILPQDTIAVNMEITGSDSRLIKIQGMEL